MTMMMKRKSVGPRRAATVRAARLDCARAQGATTALLMPRRGRHSLSERAAARRPHPVRQAASLDVEGPGKDPRSPLAAVALWRCP
eukprot:scaffold847_cov385-Prasinococcus_capsulatus_cf.AAC.14